MKKILVLFTFILLLLYSFTVVKAGECESVNASSFNDLSKIEQCKNELSGILDAISKANTTNSNELRGLQNQVAKLQAQIKILDNQLERLSSEIFEREVKRGVREELLAKRIAGDYRDKKDFSILSLLFSNDGAKDFLKGLILREKIARQDKDLIHTVLLEIDLLNKQKEQLKIQQENLDVFKKEVNKQANFLAGEVAKADKYVSDLSGKISALSARQQSLLAQKTGTYQTSVGDVPLADDPASRPDYNPGFSPAFALFSFGAPHFKGMSQYGAFGRAKNGQSAETILHAYYGDVEIKKDYDAGRQISVAGYGRMDIETYAKRIYEMPGSWGDEGGMEALKAQAVAARSYALAWTREGTGGAICTTQACQVYKNANKGGKWEEAVNATRGWILMKDGKIISSWYASTSGGYQESYNALAYLQNGSSFNTPGFWDTTSDWTRWADGAWEKAGGSPWFYKGWYKGRSGTSCGRSHPWLTGAEFADMVNAAIVYANGGDASGIFPTDGCLGQAGWSTDRMAAEADKFGGRVTSVSSVRVNHGSNGITNQVILSTNRGEVTISGSSFYKAFNLRAPGAIHLKSGLFNIERK